MRSHSRWMGAFFPLISLSMMPQTIHLPDEAAMLSYGARVASGLRAGDILALNGALGAGKTHFVKGLVAGLGSLETVTSPTFTLTHLYREGRLPVYHFDFYRLEEIGELEGIGWEEYVDSGDGVVVVEWAGKFAEAFPQGTAWWYFCLSDSGGRVVSGPHTMPLPECDRKEAGR